MTVIAMEEPRKAVGRAIAGAFMLGLLGAGAGAAWAAALWFSAGLGALCGGLAMAVFALLISYAFTADRVALFGMVYLFGSLLAVGGLIGAVVWLIRSLV